MAILVDAPTQAGKTWKCFTILTQKLKEIANKSSNSNTLILFVTQANCIASANQIIQRAKSNEELVSVIPGNNINRSSGLSNVLTNGNYMIVDYWNSRKTSMMTKFVMKTKLHWDHIYIIMDECEQGGLKGVKDRLDFIKRIEDSVTKPIINIIFITATIANLSKTILQIANADLTKYNSGVIYNFVNKPIVEHYFAKPHKNYVGAKWFKDAKDNDGNYIWRRLNFEKYESKIEQEEHKKDRIYKMLNDLPNKSKELCLIVTSTRTCEHRSVANNLFDVGFNVTVELNGQNNKNYMVKYINTEGNVCRWEIPYTLIELKAEKGNLEKFYDMNKNLVNSGITQKEDITMCHILQAALFMATDHDARIKENISVEEYNKLDAISVAICNLDKSNRRPYDYPRNPRVALVAGHIAGRGITIQNPYLDFICTSFCFTDSKDNIQRGASNAQRFGRACGMLFDVYMRKDIKPILIATEAIMYDAIANELAVMEKGDKITDGTLISLKDLVTKSKWDAIVKRAKNKFEKSKKILSDSPKMIKLLELYYNMSNNGKNEFTHTSINENAEAKALNDVDHRRTHRALIHLNYITMPSSRRYMFTEAGINKILSQ